MLPLMARDFRVTSTSVLSLIMARGVQPSIYAELSVLPE
jgi:hypothetical protein